TIKNFTFFSPNSTEFPVGSNNDGKLYMMLTGMDYRTIRRKDWSSPLNTALNVQYTNTSIIAGGRYFELLNETVALKGDSVNYIHANIDLTQTANPVSLSAETANNSNGVDINNGSGVLKVCFDIVTTSGTGVTSTKPIVQTSTLDSISVNDMTVSGSIDVPVQTLTVEAGNGLQLQLTKKNNDLVIVRFFGSVSNIQKGWNMSGTWVDRPFRPAAVQSLVGHFAGRDTSFHIDINPNGSITWWGANIDKTPIATRGNGSYFIK
nr:Chain A, PUTATIVE RECEPTOR BINDING PROTEIN [Lactococcus virus P2]2X53_B Chain B, PUTATIVE RECEPTOR BINDING PROTEIN [Lactococcus virus P2]2X53_C Chain C, PUTATIVE RECEPTOR BINDING PROTEIN [Lactococcus virus P2]2X53_D Chain D, PUTATIVE RECEPTOR BINDING PROTEIN [Lactococcus virus P2]2X53_E Chain E, PUTATIVE RECEPTOR BINDING PROTEIN [Lactococcus virus P2]2X53_F Chain F, PUTATIVE RECEPTOR BINDING PROTEIN [Lactococcus virus P2]2X53_G Chain G, PUTATIVE RECEPTOR BINDING PROTEIN [Lactococcus virus 